LSAAEDDVPEGYFSIPEYRVMTGRHFDTIRAKLKGLRPIVRGRRDLLLAVLFSRETVLGIWR
jgi:hypothetical protein